MHTSLTILIILTVVVLIVILMTSPTCKNTVGALLGRKKVEAKPKVAAKKSEVSASKAAPKKKSTLESLAKPTNTDMKAAAKALNKPQPKTPVKATPEVPKVAPIETPKVAQTETPKVNASHPVLNGSVLDMFNNTLDVKSEFGLSEEQIDALAKEYKTTHLDVHKDEVTRHRSIVRSHLEEADAKLRDGFSANVAGGKKPNTEDAIIAMRQERLDKGESLTEKRKKTAKMVLSRKR